MNRPHSHRRTGNRGVSELHVVRTFDSRLRQVKQKKKCEAQRARRLCGTRNSCEHFFSHELKGRRAMCSYGAATLGHWEFISERLWECGTGELPITN